MGDYRSVWSKGIAEPCAREIYGIDDRAISALERPDRGHHASTRFRGRAQVLSVETERSGPLDPALPERAAILDVELGIAGIDRDLVAALVGCYAGFGRLVENVLAPFAELLTRGLRHADDLAGSVLATKLYRNRTGKR